MYVHAWHSATTIALVGGSSMDMGKDGRSTGGQFTSYMHQRAREAEAAGRQRLYTEKNKDADSSIGLLQRRRRAGGLPIDCLSSPGRSAAAA